MAKICLALAIIAATFILITSFWLVPYALSGNPTVYKRTCANGLTDTVFDAKAKFPMGWTYRDRQGNEVHSTRLCDYTRVSK